MQHVDMTICLPKMFVMLTCCSLKYIYIMYKNSLCTLQKTHSASITKARELMLFTEIMTVLRLIIQDT